MLRLLVILLLLANLAWWALHWPPLAEPLGLGSEQREPQRQARQVHPERVELLPPSRAASAASGAADVMACLEAGPLDDPAFAQARQAMALAGIGPEAWVELRRELPGSWGLYMGRFTDLEQQKRKLEELQRINVPSEPAPGALAPGLLLGRYTDPQQAEAALQRLQTRGVRTARVQVLQAPTVEHRLRIERVSAAARARLPAAPVWRDCR
ncbi:hypothetical protein KAK07_24915 [Ideonella sp. 4Y16]|uniref:hypothetical protein n=1 Tax=Ideonella alba TaxID=2824118 RepID=UPI001B3740D6|nr:hypothetical protein [Ideonella alba]MBQ0946595.1 hypothetical protein [Ideonella alba]